MRAVSCLLALSLALGSSASISASQAGALRDAVKGRVEARRVETAAARSASKEMGQTTTIAGLKVSIWAPSKAGAAPLIVFSHGFGGCSTQSTFLTSALSSAGYLVIAPNHKDVACGSGARPTPVADFKDPKAWTDKTYVDRRNDIQGLLSALKSDPEWSGRIDWSHVALMGHSLGGYTVLGLAGAWPSWNTPGLSGVLALSPYCAPFLDEGRLGKIGIPVMYQGGTRDLGITPTVKRAGGCYPRTSAPAAFVEFEKAGHFAWTDLTTTAHKQIVDYSLDFFGHAFGTQRGAYTKEAGVTTLLQK